MTSGGRLFRAMRMGTAPLCNNISTALTTENGIGIMLYEDKRTEAAGSRRKRDCDSSAEEKVIRTRWSQPRSGIPSPDLLASSWSLPSVISGCDRHKKFKPPSQQAEAPRAASIPETKSLFPLRFDSLGSNIVPGKELKLPCGDNRIF